LHRALLLLNFNIPQPYFIVLENVVFHCFEFLVAIGVL
jgi:hypothetical protein